MEIRHAAIDDALEIATVHVAAWQTAYRGIIPDDILDSLDLENRRQAWERIITDLQTNTKILLVAVLGGAIAGFASGGPPAVPVEDFDGELYALYVSPDSQRRGIGRRLVTAFAVEMKNNGTTSLVLWSLAENTQARGFYEHLGGILVAESPYTIRETTLSKVAYGWKNITDLI